MYRRRNTEEYISKRSGYVLAMVDYEDIIRLKGESIIENGIYIIPRDKTKETDALIVINIPILISILDNAYVNNYDNIYNNKCEYIKCMRKHPLLQFVNEVQTLYMKYVYTIYRIVNMLKEEGWIDQYVVLNIEPKGTGRLEKMYPAPVITIPGGTMENLDNNDYEVCAFREFFEETCINIEDCKYICIAKDRLKCNKHNSFNTFIKKHKHYKANGFQISFYYTIKLLYPNITDEVN
jgi:hypothetical protein